MESERLRFCDYLQRLLRSLQLLSRRLTYLLDNVSAQVDSIVASFSNTFDNRRMSFPSMNLHLAQLRVAIQNARAEHSAVQVRIDALIDYLSNDPVGGGSMVMEMLDTLSMQVQGKENRKN